jgi:hypothetical protein
VDKDLSDNIKETIKENIDAKMWAVSGDAYFPCEKRDIIS